MAAPLKAAGGVVKVAQKHTQQSYGVWETIRRFFAVDPERSNGVPVKHFRNPTPGGLDPASYDEAVTAPAADIADNPYWKRDVRRNYERLSTVTQGDAVGLLTVGSAAQPKPTLLAGEAGAKQLVEVAHAGQKGLGAYFAGEGALAGQVLGEGGLPPLPAGFGRKKEAKVVLDAEQSYAGQYPCRNFV